MKGNNFLRISDLTPDEVWELVQKAESMKKGQTPRLMEGKIIALVFEKPSLRTRVSFEVGIRQMGGECVYLSKDDVGLGVREPEADVARVLDRWVDGVVARVYSHRSLEILAEHTSVPVVNALSDLEHPCQAIADLLTIYEHKGSFEGLNVAFVGDGNNVSSSLALACSSVGANFVIASPKDYKIPTMVWEQAQQRASRKESKMRWVEQPTEAVIDADVVYTDTWVSMGHEAEKEERVKVFEGYQVDEKLLGGAKSNAVFMHDMPAYRGLEISDTIIDHPQSVVFDQAENRLHAQKAILAELYSRM